MAYDEQLAERVRGLLTACIFDEETDGNLLRQAKAIHALESVLGSHFRATLIVARGAAGTRS